MFYIKTNNIIYLIGATILLTAGCVSHDRGQNLASQPSAASSDSKSTKSQVPGTKQSLSFPTQVALSSLAPSIAKMNDAETNREKIKLGEQECVFDGNRSEKDNQLSFDRFVDRIASEQTGFDSKQRKEAFEIIKTGKFQQDIQGTVTAISEAGVGIPNAIWSTIINLPGYLKSPKDLFWKNPLASNVREVARVLTAPDNRSVRLAIIAYANMQGLKIKESDLDLLHKELGKSNGPALNALANQAVNRFTDSIPAKDLVSKFKTFDDSCHI
jgi:hypothetical protein